MLSWRQSRLGLPVVETPGYQRLRRHAGMEVRIRARLSIWHLFQVRSHCGRPFGSLLVPY